MAWRVQWNGKSNHEGVLLIEGESKSASEWVSGGMGERVSG
jgi:hypothetical protein